jgi:hypothetical protein
MKISFRIPALALMLGLAACAHTVPLVYERTVPIASAGPPVVTSVSTVDQRGEDDPRWFGAIRSGYGNPLKVLNTPTPLAEAVSQAFRAALAARGMMATANGQGDIDMEVTIEQFESDQYLRREAQIRFTLSLTSRRLGRQIYRDTIATDLLEGSLLNFESGAFGSVEKLRLVVQSALSQTIDATLARPGFIDVVRADGIQPLS